MPEDLTPNADELTATNDKASPGTANAIEPPRSSAEPRSTESLRDNALRDNASNEADRTETS